MHSYFFALFPDAATRDRIAGAAASVQQRCRLRGRPVDPARLHLTLHFIGRFAAAQADLEARAQAVGAAMTAAPVAFVLDHATSFARPRGKAPCVFGVGDGAARLGDLAARLEAAMAPANDAGRPFRPHVTWLYSSDRIDGACSIAPIAWRAQTLSLAHGIAGESAYRILACWPLMADPPNA
ncbi:MAG: 2'-5' RNA ligase family protein [Dokdonella sp.]|nr:2'-5' RNA ligase family protein [Xanthomonadales bacterium]